MSSEMTRGSISGQVKALSMIVAIEGMIPDRRASSVENRPAAPPPQIYPAAGLRKQEATTGSQEEDGLGDPSAEPAPVSAADADSSSDPGEPAFDDSFSFSETPSSPYARTPGSLLYRQERLRAPLTSELAPNAPRALKGSNFIEFYENRGDIPPIPTLIPAPHPDFLLRSAGRGRACGFQ
jgi:hypothetical protein